MRASSACVRGSLSRRFSRFTRLLSNRHSLDGVAVLPIAPIRRLAEDTAHDVPQVVSGPPTEVRIVEPCLDHFGVDVHQTQAAVLGFDVVSQARLIFLLGAGAKRRDVFVLPGLDEVRKLDLGLENVVGSVARLHESVPEARGFALREFGTSFALGWVVGRRAVANDFRSLAASDGRLTLNDVQADTGHTSTVAERRLASKPMASGTAAWALLTPPSIEASVTWAAVVIVAIQPPGSLVPGGPCSVGPSRLAVGCSSLRAGKDELSR